MQLSFALLRHVEHVLRQDACERGVLQEHPHADRVVFLHVQLADLQNAPAVRYAPGAGLKQVVRQEVDNHVRTNASGGQKQFRLEARVLRAQDVPLDKLQVSREL